MQLMVVMIMNNKAYDYCKKSIKLKTTPKYVKLQMKDFIRICDGKDKKYILSKPKLDQLNKILKILNMPKGLKAGQTLFECTTGYQWLFYTAILCIVYKDNPNKRRYETGLLEICRKNFKTYTIATIFIILFLTEPQFSKFYSVAPDGALSKEIREAISETIRSSPLIYQYKNTKRFKILRDYIKFNPKESIYTPLAFSTSRMDGRLPSVFCADEVGALNTNYPIEAMRSGQLNILNKLGFIISTKYPTIDNPFEDDLMVRFGSDKYKGMLASLGFKGDQVIQNKMLAGSFETAQKRVEGNNFDIRKQLLNYDDVMNNQREIIYAKRNEILDSESIHDQTISLFRDHVADIVNDHLIETNRLNDNDYSEILEASNENLLKNHRIALSEIKGKSPSDVIEIISELVIKEYNEKLEEIPDEIKDEFEKAITLQVIDSHWMDHISTMSHLREGIGLRGYANENPLQAYTIEGYDLFDAMMRQINKEVAIYLLKAEIRQNIERKEVAKNAITNDGKETKKIQAKSKKKVGRNDPCPCGSGKKYKQCCGK